MKIEIEISDGAITRLIKESIDQNIDDLTFDYDVEDIHKFVDKKSIANSVLEKREECEKVIKKFFQYNFDEEYLIEFWYDYRDNELDKIIDPIINSKELKKVLKDQEKLKKIKETEDRINLVRKQLDQAGYKIVKK